MYLNFGAKIENGVFWKGVGRVSGSPRTSEAPVSGKNIPHTPIRNDVKLTQLVRAQDC